MTTSSISDRFWSYVQGGDVDTCWEWIGHKQPTGYAHFYVSGSGKERLRQYSHRFAYEELRCDIPAGLEIDHLCRNRGCVNPWHMEPVTHKENQVRMGPHRPKRYNMGPTCKAGHERNEENTRINSNGAQVCVLCRREAVRRSRLKRLGRLE